MQTARLPDDGNEAVRRRYGLVSSNHTPTLHLQLLLMNEAVTPIYHFDFDAIRSPLLFPSHSHLNLNLTVVARRSTIRRFPLRR